MLVHMVVGGTPYQCEYLLVSYNTRLSPNLYCHCNICHLAVVLCTDRGNNTMWHLSHCVHANYAGIVPSVALHGKQSQGRIFFTIDPVPNLGLGTV